MDLFDSMHSLRAMRRLKPDPIPDEALDTRAAGRGCIFQALGAAGRIVVGV